MIRESLRYSGIFIFTILLASYLNTAVGQDLDESFYNIKQDTLSVRKGNREQLLAANAANKPKAYKHIPYAIDTTYFGSQVNYITKYTEKYLRSHNRTLSTVQERSLAVFPLIDSIMVLNKIPKQLKYLAVIESALNNHARSRVGAVGPWQFMSYTGREMGLIVNGKRDDRKDWTKSTNAAAKYLMELYEDLDDWLLVIAAYNSGPRPVKRAIARTGSTNFWDIKPYLPRETQGHVLAFVATATIFEKLDYYIGEEIPDNVSYTKPKIKKEPGKPKPKLRFSEEELKQMIIVKIKEPIYLELLCTELDIDQKTMDHWNYDYELFEYNTYSTDYYNLRIPRDKMNDFFAKKVVLENLSKKIYSDQNIQL